MKTPPPHTFLRLALVAGFALTLHISSAADFTSTWNGTTGNWTDSAKWTTPGAPGTFPNNGGSTYDAVLNAGTSSLTGDITINNFTLNGTLDMNGPRTLSLNGLTGSGIIDNTAFTNGVAVTVQVGNNNASSVFAGTIKNTSSSITLTKVGTGTLTLSGSNTFSGVTNLQGGTLKIGADDALPSTNQVVFNNGTGALKLDLNGFNNTLNKLWLGGAAGSTSTVETGAGTLTLSGFNSANILYGAGSGSGAVINGNLKMGATNYETILINVGNEAAVANDLTINAAISSSQGSAFSKSGAGTLLLTASNNTYGFDSTASTGGNTTISAGTLKLGANNVIPDGNHYGNVVFGSTAGAKLDMAGFSDTINGLTASTTGVGNVDNSTGNSTLTIGANNASSNFRGTLTNSGGTLNVAKTGTSSLVFSQPSVLGTYTGTTTISGGFIQTSFLANGGSASHIGASSNAASNLVLDGGTLLYGNLGFGDGGATSLDRLFTVTANGGGISASGTGALNFNNTGAYVASGTGDRTLTLQGSNTGANTLAGIIANPTSGNTNVTKSQTGSWVLSGANTYGGTTTVGAGTLTATGSSALGATTGALAVNNTNTNAGTAVVLNLSTTAPTTKGSLSGTISTPSSGTNTATINNGGQVLTINQTVDATFAGTIAGNGGFTLGSLSTKTLTLSAVKSYTGLTTVQKGTLVFTGGDGGSTSSSFNVASGGTLRFGGANFTLGATVTITGNGTAEFSAGTVTANGQLNLGDINVTGGTLNVNGANNIGSGVTVTSGTLNVSSSIGAFILGIGGGEIKGSGTVTGAAWFSWTGGVMSGSGVTNSNDLTTFGDASLTMDQRTLNLSSSGVGDHSISSPNTRLNLNNNATLNNSAQLNLQNNQAITGDGTGTFNNTGTITRNNATGPLSNGGNGTFSISNVAFTNTGTINADTGTLAFDNLNMQAGSLTGAGTVNATTLNWSGGTLAGSGPLNLSGTNSTITSTDSKGLDRTLNNTGTITFTGTFGAGGQIQFGVGTSTPGVINNSGTFNLMNGASFQTTNANAGHAINNSGTWNVSGGFTSGLNTGIKFNNSGAVTVSGNATFVTNGGGTQTGSFSVASGSDLWLVGSNLNSGSSVTGAGKVTLGGTTINTGSTYNTSGETHMRGGITTFNTSATTGTFTGGTNQTHLKVSGAATKLTVNGTFTNNTEYTTLEGGAIIETTAFDLNGGELNGNGNINGSLTSNGSIAPGASPGQITVNGNTVLGSGSILNFEIGAGSPGNNYDVLTVNGTILLGGELRLAMLSNFGSINPGDTFNILTSTSAISGLFANISPGQRLVSEDLLASFIVNYGASSGFGSNQVVLSNFLNLTPEPSRAMLMMMGATSLMMRRRRQPSSTC